MHIERPSGVVDRALTSRSPSPDWDEGAARSCARRRRKYGAILVALVAAILVNATDAEADTAPTYPALLPASIHVQRNAAAITMACARARDSVQTGCPAYNFCSQPLELKQAATELPVPLQFSYGVPTEDQITGGICPTKKPPDAGAAGKGIADAFGPSWQSAALSGLAAFIVERAQAEALASLADQLKKALCASDAWLLPATCGLLQGIDPYSDPIGWSLVKAALEIDLPRLPELLLTKQLGADGSQPLVALVQAAMLIERGTDPVQTVVGLRQKYDSISTPQQCSNSPYACSLRLLGSATEILAPSPSASDSHGVSNQDLVLYFQIAARLLYDGDHSIGIRNSYVMDYASFESALRATRNLIDAIRAETAKPASGQSTASRVTHYAVVIAQVLKEIPVAALLPDASRQMHLLQISAALEHLARSLDDFRAREFVDGFIELQAGLAAAKIEPPAWFVKYGGVAVELASANTSDDVKQALEAAAAPVGAWHNKRGRGHKSVTINSYVGLQGGIEWLAGDGSPSGRALHGGLFAPVGLEVGRGFGKAWSAGLLISAIDLGALLDVRESATQMTASGQDKVDTTSTVGVRQVFSPGFYGVLGLGLLDGVPLTFGAGLSLAPELRSMSVEGGAVRQLSAARLNVFLAIDVPLFRL